MRKPTFWFSTWSDIKRALLPQKMARGLKIRIYEVEGLYYPSSGNKDAEHLREVDLRLCFPYAKSRFSHNEAQITCGVSMGRRDKYLFSLSGRHDHILTPRPHSVIGRSHQARSVTNATTDHSQLIVDFFWYFKFRYETLRVHAFRYD